MRNREASKPPPLGLKGKRKGEGLPDTCQELWPYGEKQSRGQHDLAQRETGE